jgi:hypothetical protein
MPLSIKVYVHDGGIPFLRKKFISKVFSSEIDDATIVQCKQWANSVPTYDPFHSWKSQ